MRLAQEWSPVMSPETKSRHSPLVGSAFLGHWFAAER